MILRSVREVFVVVMLAVNAETIPFLNSNNRGTFNRAFYNAHQSPRIASHSPHRVSLQSSPGIFSHVRSSSNRQPAAYISNMTNLFHEGIGIQQSNTAITLGQYMRNFHHQTAQKFNQFGNRIKESVQRYDDSLVQGMRPIQNPLHRRFNLSEVNNRLKGTLRHKKRLMNKLHSMGWNGKFVGVPHHTMNDDHEIVKKPGISYGYFFRPNIRPAIYSQSIPSPAILPNDMLHPDMPQSLTTSADTHGVSNAPGGSADYVFPITLTPTYTPNVTVSTETPIVTEIIPSMIPAELFENETDRNDEPTLTTKSNDLTATSLLILDAQSRIKEENFGSTIDVETTTPITSTENSTISMIAETGTTAAGGSTFPSVAANENGLTRPSDGWVATEETTLTTSKSERTTAVPSKLMTIDSETISVTDEIFPQTTAINITTLMDLSPEVDNNIYSATTNSELKNQVDSASFPTTTTKIIPVVNERLPIFNLDYDGPMIEIETTTGISSTMFSTESLDATATDVMSKINGETTTAIPLTLSDRIQRQEEVFVDENLESNATTKNEERTTETLSTLPFTISTELSTAMETIPPIINQESSQITSTGTTIVPPDITSTIREFPTATSPGFNETTTTETMTLGILSTLPFNTPTESFATVETQTISTTNSFELESTTIDQQTTKLIDPIIPTALPTDTTTTEGYSETTDSRLNSTTIIGQTTAEILSTLPFNTLTETFTTVQTLSTTNNFELESTTIDQQTTKLSDPTIPTALPSDTTTTEGYSATTDSRLNSTTIIGQTTAEILSTLPFNTPTETFTTVQTLSTTNSFELESTTIDQQTTKLIDPIIPTALPTDTTTTEEYSATTDFRLNSTTIIGQTTTKILSTLPTTIFPMTVSEASFSTIQVETTTIDAEVDATTIIDRGSTGILSTLPTANSTETSTNHWMSPTTASEPASTTIDGDITTEILLTLPPAVLGDNFTTMETPSNNIISEYIPTMIDEDLTTKAESITHSTNLSELTTTIEALFTTTHAELDTTVNEEITEMLSTFSPTLPTTISTGISTITEPISTITTSAPNGTTINTATPTTTTGISTTIDLALNTATTTEIPWTSPTGATLTNTGSEVGTTTIDEKSTTELGVPPIPFTNSTEPTTIMNEISTMADPEPTITTSTIDEKTVTNSVSTIPTTIPTEATTTTEGTPTSTRMEIFSTTNNPETTTEIVPTLPASLSMSNKGSTITDTTIDVEATMETISTSQSNMFSSEMYSTTDQAFNGTIANNETIADAHSTIFFTSTTTPSPGVNSTLLHLLVGGLESLTTEATLETEASLFEQTIVTNAEVTTHSEITNEETTNDDISTTPSTVSTQIASTDEISTTTENTPTLSFMNFTVNIPPLFISADQDTIPENIQNSDQFKKQLDGKENFEYPEVQHESKDKSLGRRLDAIYEPIPSRFDPLLTAELDEKTLLYLIPVIIDELRQDRLSFTEKQTLSQVFGELWPLLEEDAKRKPGEYMSNKLGLFLFAIAQRISDAEESSRVMAASSLRSKTKRHIIPSSLPNLTMKKNPVMPMAPYERRAHKDEFSPISQSTVAPQKKREEFKFRSDLLDEALHFGTKSTKKNAMKNRNFDSNVVSNLPKETLQLVAMPPKFKEADKE